MGKVKAAVEERCERRSERLALKPQRPPNETKSRKKAAAVKVPKQKKAKSAENGSKAEEPKAEATEAK